MAPKQTKNGTPSPDPNGMFSRVIFFLVENGVRPRRLQIWKQKLVQMGATIETRLSKKVTYVLATNSEALLQQVDRERLKRFKGRLLIYQWLEDSLRQGEKASEDPYLLHVDLEGKSDQDESFVKESVDGNTSSDEPSLQKKVRSSFEDFKSFQAHSNEDAEKSAENKESDSPRSHDTSSLTSSPAIISPKTHSTPSGDSSLAYCPPDLNRNITEICGKLINIYRGETCFLPLFMLFQHFFWVSVVTFSLVSCAILHVNAKQWVMIEGHLAITKLFQLLRSCLSKLKVQTRSKICLGSGSHCRIIKMHLPVNRFLALLILLGKITAGIGMCLQIQEIVTTGKLSKLEHFEADEKVRTISLFGEVWGIGPATALKLYDKGYRTLDDLKNEDSLTHAQKIGLKYFDDIKTRIPRDEVREMEQLLQKVGEEILPGVVVICGGSYRRGKSSCGDLDVVITHPDGKSHKGFLPRYVERLKDMKFLREDLVFSVHSKEGTDSGVDTYFGLCTYPGRELRHRIDLKVYPRDIYAFGLLAWTGNDVLNRRLRLLAESKGFRLDDTGLFPATQASGKRGARATISLRLDTEKEVLDFLGFPWLEPHERNL